MDKDMMSTFNDLDEAEDADDEEGDNSGTLSVMPLGVLRCEGLEGKEFT